MKYVVITGKEVKSVMPGFVIHLAIAKEYLKRHQEDGEDEEEFYRGVIAPDLLKKPESHYGPSTSEPNFERYAKETGLSSSYERGYYLHLLTDKDFYLSYGDIFSEDFYHDYNKLNQRLIHTFQIQIPEEIKEIVKFEEGEPMILSFTGMYYFIKGFAEDLKKLTDGPTLIRSKIKFLEVRDWMRLKRIIQERELKKVFDLDDRIMDKELYVDTIHEVSNEELFHQHIVTIHWKKFDEIRRYIKSCQSEAFSEGSNEIFEAIVHVMYLHHIMNRSGTRGVLEKTNKLSKAPYGEFLVCTVELMKSGKAKSDAMDETFALYEAYSRNALRDYILHIYIVCMFLAYDNNYCLMNKLEERFDMYRQFIPEKYKTAFQAFLLQCALNKRGDFYGSTSASLIYKLANEGYAPACYEYAIRVMPKCAPYDLDDYGEETTEYYDDCRIAEKYFQKARDGGIKW